MLDFADAQRRLGVSRATLVRWLRDGRVTGYKAGRQWRFRADDLALVLREGQVAYGTQTGAVATRSLIAAGVPVTPGGITPPAWIAWQDAQQWLWIGLDLAGDTARLRAAREDTAPQEWRLPLPTARAVLQSWQVWRAGTGLPAPRPGMLTDVRGAAGEVRAVLCLPTHLDRVPRLWKAPARGRAAAPPRGGGRQTWQVRGPARRTTVAAAFHLARALAAQQQIAPADIVIAEAEPTYFWPSALHVYGELCTGACALPARLRIAAATAPVAVPAPSLRGPAVSITYCFDPADARNINILCDGRVWRRVALPR
jgi:excisionase family DNA binding protein